MAKRRTVDDKTERALVYAMAAAGAIWRSRSDFADLVPRLWPREDDIARMWAHNVKVDAADYEDRLSDFIHVSVVAMFLCVPVACYLVYARHFPAATVDKYGSILAVPIVYPLSWLWGIARVRLTRWKLRHYSFERAKRTLIPRAEVALARHPGDSLLLHFLRAGFEGVGFA